MICLWLELFPIVFPWKSLNNVLKSDGTHNKVIFIKVMHWKMYNSNVIIIISGQLITEEVKMVMHNVLAISCVFFHLFDELQEF